MPSSASPTTALPPLYRSPVVLRFPEHAGFGLRRGGGFGFASSSAAIPVVAGEFAEAGRHYPLVFSNDHTAMPLAVTGVRHGENLFVNSDGGWRKGGYIPGYLRRFPFIGIAQEAGRPLLLGIDSASDRLAAPAREGEADPFFAEDGVPTDVSRAAITMCEAYALEHERTRAFADALRAHDLLVERTADIRYAILAGQPAATTPDARVRGFRLVDETAYRALSAAALAEFHARGWLDLIVLHLTSQARWQGLVDISASRRASAG